MVSTRKAGFGSRNELLEFFIFILAPVLAIVAKSIERQNENEEFQKFIPTDDAGNAGRNQGGLTAPAALFIGSFFLVLVFSLGDNLDGRWFHLR